MLRGSRPPEPVDTTLPPGPATLATCHAAVAPVNVTVTRLIDVFAAVFPSRGSST